MLVMVFLRQENTLNVLYDDVTIGLDSNILEVKDSGITATQLANKFCNNN